MTKQIETIDRAKFLLDELNKIESELTRRHKENGIFYYMPNRKQLEAHTKVALEIYFCGGNRAGKTTFIIAESIFALTGKYPDYFPEKRKLNHPIKLRIISTKFKEGINDTIEPKLMALLPAASIVPRSKKRTPQGYITHLEVFWRDGKGISTIDFLSQEQDIMSFESTDADMVISDEPLKRAIYIAVSRGLLDRNGTFICAYTALAQAWMKDVTDQADDKKIAFIVADIRDNKFDILGNPILKEEAIQRFEEKLTDDEKEIRLHGKYYHLAGLVYKELDSVVHQVDKLPEKYITWVVLDPHDRNPHWAIFAAVDPTGDITIYDELIMEGGLYELAKEIKSKESVGKMAIHSRLIDPNFGHKPSSVGSNITVQDQLRKFGVEFVDAIDDEEAGQASVREYLRYNKHKLVDFTNRPKLYFLKGKVPQTWKAMQNLQYKDWKTLQDQREENEKIMELHKHAADCIKYLCIAQPRYKKFKKYEGIDEKIYY